MLNQALLDRTRLHPRPIAQRLIADGFLRFDYRKVELIVEGDERLPTRPVLFVMNHTDDFNYWPLQYHLHARHRRYTATWVKGKNYEHPVLRAFMRATNNIPLPSRGYLITRDFMNAVGRRPNEREYRSLREALNRLEDPAGVPDELLALRRDMLGRPFDPTRERYVDALEALFVGMIDRFVSLNEEALRIGLDLLVFPQGSRSKRLSRGHIGVAQMALHLGVPIVPVGCSGSDVIYPRRSPIALPGRVVYRIGDPLGPEELAPFAVPAGVRPFHRDDEVAHREQYQALVDEVMDRIDRLVDEPYRFAEGARSQGTRGTARFV